MHSSRMRTGRSLTLCQSLLPGGVVCSGGSGPGGVSGPGGCLLGGRCLLLGVSAPGGGLGVCSLGGGCLVLGGLLREVVSQHALRQTHPL